MTHAIRVFVAELAIVAAVLLWAQPGWAYGKSDVDAAYVYWFTWYQFDPGQESWATKDCTEGVDSVMYLWDWSSGQTLAWNDECDALDACIEDVELPPGWYTLVVVRAWWGGIPGTCDLWRNGALFEDDIPVDGTWLEANMVSGDSGQTTLLNQGIDDTMLFGFEASGDLVAIDDDEGVGAASKFVAASPIVRVLVSSFSPGSGMARALVNDLPQDTDGDGIGPELEHALCTCDSSWDSTPGCAETSCSTAYVRSPVDSDGDGIWDHYETFGVDGVDPNDFAQHLPRWGADPARKDIFLEIDKETVYTMMFSPASAEAVAGIFDTVGTQSYLRNRDGSHGIKVHIDIGDAAQGPENTVFGDWGSGGQVNPDRSNPPPEFFAPIRHGIFHYAVVRQFGGGNATCCGSTFSCAYNDPRGVCHELGHNLDLDHGGTKAAINQNSKPHYRSLMNYSIQAFHPAFGFSLGEFASFPVNPAALCEAAGLGTTSRPEIEYLQVEPYNYLVEADCTQDGDNRCGIDWNRDGDISDCSVVVQAAPNQTKDIYGSPELGRYYRYDDLSSGDIDPTTTPSVTRAFGRMYVAYRTSTGAIKLLYTDHPDFRTGCTNPGVGCATWTSLPVDATSDASGPAIATVADTKKSYLMVVYKKNGDLRFYLYKSNHHIQHAGTVPGATGAVYEFALGNISGNQLLLLHRKGTVGQNGDVYGNTYDAGPQSWTSAALQYADGQPLSTFAVGGVAASPQGTFGVYASVFLPGSLNLNWKQYMGANTWETLPDTNMEAHQIDHDFAPKRIGIAWRPYSGGLMGGRWYLAYNRAQGIGGQLDKGVVMFDMTQGDGTNKPVFWNNLTRYDNVWCETRAGLALFGWQPGLPEERLRLAFVFRKSDTEHMLAFRPFGDGIVDIQLKDTNDWVVMERGLCGSLHGSTDLFCGGTSNPSCTAGCGQDL